MPFAERPPIIQPPKEKKVEAPGQAAGSSGDPGDPNGGKGGLKPFTEKERKEKSNLNIDTKKKSNINIETPKK